MAEALVHIKSDKLLEKADQGGQNSGIVATQEQALTITSTEAGVYYSRWAPRYRMCKDATDSPTHKNIHAETAYNYY